MAINVKSVTCPSCGSRVKYDDSHKTAMCEFCGAVLDMTEEYGEKKDRERDDVACYTDVDAALCAYHAYGSAYDSEGNGPFNLNVAVAVCSVFAESVPQGTLPVNIPKIIENEDESISYSDQLLYERGFGICVTEK